MSLYDINDKTRIDEFGVDHNNFSLRDEIEYNFRRAKEKELQQCLRPKSQIDAINNNTYNFPKGFSAGEIAIDGIKGMAQGIGGALERSLNTISGGAYDVVSDFWGDNGYERRQRELENLAKQENLQKPLKYLNYFNDAVIGTYGANKLKQYGEIPGYIYSLYKNMR